MFIEWQADLTYIICEHVHVLLWSRQIKRASEENNNSYRVARLESLLLITQADWHKSVMME